MKKFFMLAVAAVVALSATAANGVQDFGKLLRNADRQLKANTLTMGTSAQPAKAKRQASANAPESITGKSFITVYNDSKNNFNGYFTVAADGDGIILEGFAKGYDIKASYDAATGIITIPTGVVIGTSPTYGDITLHALDAESKHYLDSPITGTVEGNKVAFNYGVYGSVVYNGEQSGLIWMQDIDTREATGKMSFTLQGSKFECPVMVTKTAENTLNIVGMNTLFTNGYFYNVPVTFNAATKAATLKTETPVGHAIATNGTGVKNIYYMFSVTTDGLVRDPAFTIATADGASTITANSNLFLGYDANGAGQYSGWTLESFKFEVDCNILTQEVQEDPYASPTAATVGNITYSLDNDANTAEVTGCLGSVKDLDIPATITVKDNTYTVTSIAEKAFYGNRTLTAVRIPATIKTVGHDAFRKLDNLNSLYIADLEAWCAIDFYNGNANPIYNVFPTSTSKWGKVYVDNVATTEIVIPEGVTKIGRAFYGFKSLTSVTLPSTLTELGDQTFANCTGLTTVTIPESVEKIGSSFWGCEGLTEISIPGSVKTLGNSTFYGCKALKSIKLSEGIETIGSMTFSGCSALEAITLPSTVNEIKMMAFSDCKGIKEITSLNTVPPTCAGDRMFEDFLTATLFVPEASMDAYKAATSWKEFTTVEAVKTTGIETVCGENANGKKEYFNLQGMKVAENELTSGAYIVRDGAKTTKVYINAK
ncbi:MAG: leucine-rich repeat domain-containing protein [Bacteroidales bacterium]|nr:leucine-rich repeat domain-containing protein [Bacteroidales bacterium]MCM1146888.1 leucine-rich repeat domain-containing protein [Bacteroidales bacterium]MCM1205614.1 leucine-rich repeat domain-containing protein [Bacillota bacterium]MCM1510275.1 leucine-rich repeat domain-containing protein [Clostridium sp.]